MTLQGFRFDHISHKYNVATECKERLLGFPRFRTS